MVAGLRVDGELLSASSGALEFVNQLLRDRQVRAVRTTNAHLRGKLKCMRIGDFTGCGLGACTCTSCPLIKSRSIAGTRVLEGGLGRLWGLGFGGFQGF